jgi:hypothetical protein
MTIQNFAQTMMTSFPRIGCGVFQSTENDLEPQIWKCLSVKRVSRAFGIGVQDLKIRNKSIFGHPTLA